MLLHSSRCCLTHTFRSKYIATMLDLQLEQQQQVLFELESSIVATDLLLKVCIKL